MDQRLERLLRAFAGQRLWSHWEGTGPPGGHRHCTRSAQARASPAGEGGGMRRLSSFPLRLRLVAAVVLLSALALGLSGAAATASLRGYLLHRVDAQLSQAVEHLADEP